MESVQLLVQGNVNIENRNVIIDPSVAYQKIHRLSIGGYLAGENGMIGAKVHLLSGVESLYTESLKVEINAQEDFFALDFRKNISVMSSGVINYNGLDDIEYIGGDQVYTPVPITTNTGIGFSVYGKANLGDKLRLYGIIDDIGSIRWDWLTLSLGNRLAAQKLLNIGLGVELSIADRFGLVMRTTNPWAFGKYYDMPYGDFSLGMSYRM